MTADIVAATLAGLGPMIQSSARKPLDKYASRRRYGDALLLQGAQYKPLQGGVVEGLARAGQAVLGGWLANRADEQQTAEEDTQRQGIMDAIAKAQASGDFSPVAQALAKAGQVGPAASLLFADMASRRTQGQATDRAAAITGGGIGMPPGMAPPGGAAPQTGGPPNPFNPGNIISGRNPDGSLSFRTYDSPEAGVAALVKNAMAYPSAFNGGQPMTIAQIGQRWAPQDNRGTDPVAWARAVSQVSGLPADQPIDLSNPQVALAFARGVHAIEKGQGAAYPPDVYLRGVQMALGSGQPQAQGGQPPAPTVVAGPPMAPPQGALPPGVTPVANPPQGPQPDDSGEGLRTPGFQTMPAPNAVPVPQPFVVDDGREDMARAKRLYEVGVQNRDQRAIEDATKFFQQGQAKAMAAQQRLYDRQMKPPERVTLPDGTVAPVTGGAADPAVISRDETAKVQGRGVLRPGVDPNTGAPGLENPVTGDFKPAAAPFNETQGKAATFADRMTASERNLREVEGQGTNTWGAFLERLGGAGNYFQSPEYQRYEQARRDFVNAVLRRESGAVISPEEFSNAEKQYFPRPGDTPQVIEQKRRNRQIAIDGMMRDAGPAYKPRQDAPRAGGPAVGAIEDGYRFKGGNPADPKSWEKVQ